MPQPLIGQTELPPVSILQMILEGPKGYFGRRGQESDAQWFQQQAQKQQGAYAQSLINTPEWKTAMTNPYDRMAQGPLWALAEAGPGNIPNQGANWLQTAIGGAYGREQASFEDALQKSRIHMTTDEALRLEQGKIDIANRQLMNQMKLFQPDAQSGLSPAQAQAQGNMQYDVMAHNIGLAARPDGYSWDATQGAMVPTYGQKPWQEMTAKLSPLQQTQGAVAELLDMDANGVTDVGRHQSLIATVQDGIRQGSAMGTLDEGAMKQMNKYIADYDAYTGYSTGTLGTPIPNPVGSKNFAIAQEKLRALRDQTGKKIVDWQRTYVVDPRQLGDPYAYTPAAEKVKPSDTARAEVERLNKAQQEQSGGQVGAAGLPSLFKPSGPKPDEKPLLKSRQEELKRKFPGAKF